MGGELAVRQYALIVIVGGRMKSGGTSCTETAHLGFAEAAYPYFSG